MDTDSRFFIDTQGEVDDMIPIVAFYQEEDKKLYTGSRTFAFHEYAYGNTGEVFEEDNT